jgi:mannose-1-phosphate guanylyltransferase
VRQDPPALEAERAQCTHTCPPLCGYTGTRLWTLSQATYPNQYWDQYIPLQQTRQRLEGISGVQPSLLICNEDHRFIGAEQVRQIGVETAAILLEPGPQHRSSGGRGGDL